LSSFNQEVRVDYASNLPSLPSIDFYLENDIGKAVLMLNNFRSVHGEEKIPKELVDIASGIVLLTIVKAGFVVTGRYGTGLVVTKLNNFGDWSAPSAVSTIYVVYYVYT
jgi:lipid-binding SYLF domain-containing protein